MLNFLGEATIFWSLSGQRLKVPLVGSHSLVTFWLKFQLGQSPRIAEQFPYFFSPTVWELIAQELLMDGGIHLAYV